ncbi:MAG: M56 family metallopeptidase, partial [Sedimentisphaerales bacterium]
MYHVINNVMMGLNRVGGVFYDYAASVFIQSALLVILLFAIDLLLRKRVRAIFRYCVWLLVLVKLILPPMLSLPTGIGYWAGDHLPAAPGASNMAFDADALEFAGPSGEMRQVRPTENIAGDDPAMARLHSALTPLTWQAVVFLLWLAGVLAFLVVLVQRIRFVKGLVAASCPPGDDLTGLLEQCRRQMAVRRDIRLRLSEAIPSPAVCGLLRPTVLMPTSLVEKLSPEGLRATLIHELAHIKRGDLWINSVQTFLQVVYFYNPFVWFANSIIRKVCEEAVDETVLVALGGQAKDYSNTLIDIGEMVFWKADLGLRLVGVAESKKALQWRIRHMLNRPIPKSSKLGAFGVIAIFTIAAVLLPMAKAEKSTEDNKPVATESERKPTKSLHQAVVDGDIEQVKLLIAKGADVNASMAGQSWTPLLDAANAGHAQVVKVLLENGAKVDVGDDYGYTPLVYALWSKDEESV